MFCCTQSVHAQSTRKRAWGMLLTALPTLRCAPCSIASACYHSMQCTVLGVDF